MLYIDHKSCVRIACQCYHPQRTVVYVIHSRLSMPPNFPLNCHQKKRLHCTFITAFRNDGVFTLNVIERPRKSHREQGEEGEVGISKKAEIKVQGVMGEPVGGQWVREQCSYSWLQVTFFQ